MIRRTAFELDCSDVISECGYECGRCLRELKSAVVDMQGVDKFYQESDGVIVEHNPEIISTEQLRDIFKTLPSFYQGKFIPSIIS